MISRKNPSPTRKHPTSPKIKKEAEFLITSSAASMKKQNGTVRRKIDADGKETSDGKKNAICTFGIVSKRKKETFDELELALGRKQKLMSNGQIANPTQKQQRIEEKGKTKSAISSHQQTNGVNPLDTILDEIEAFDTANKKKSKKEIESGDDEANNAPCSSKQLPPTPMPASYRSLNKMELARQDQDQSMVHSFLGRDDLMQRILAYKMLKGRVESYSIISIKIDLDNCTLPEYELNPTGLGKNGSPFGKVSPVVNDEPIDNKLKIDNPETPDHSGLKRGPMTPPGSPGTNRSSTPEADAKPNLLPYQSCFSVIPSTAKKEADGPLEDGATKETLRNFCTLTGISTEMLRNFLGDDLHKLDKLKMEDLMKTFLVSLKQIATKKDRAGDGDCSSSKLMQSPVTSVVLPKDDKAVMSAVLSMDQAEQRAEDNLEMDAMEISSQSTDSSGAFSFSNCLLPPPPAPPPILDGTENVFIVPPPPPPPPLLLERNASSVLPSSPPNSFASPPSQKTEKPFLSKCIRPLSPDTSRSCEKINFAERREHILFSAAVSPFKKNTKRPKTYDEGANKRGKPISLRFPKPLKSSTRKGSIEGRIGRARQKILATVTTTDSQRPVSLLSLNLVDPYPETTPIGYIEMMDDNSALEGTSMPLPQHVMKLHNNKEQSRPKREVPITVDLEFIKNTPPPPIPDIIRRRISRDNMAEAMGVMSLPVPSALSVQKRPPQSLLHMDLTRPPVFPLHHPPPTFRQPKITPPLPSVVTTPNASTVLQTVVQAIGGNLAMRPPPPPNTDVSPYGKFFK